jgi:glycosyltransferase involved in cell wall biosynthesis
MNEELVSIIMPAFNAERFISQALESVASQTYTRWEIIVTNDGGTDNTAEIVSTFARQISQPLKLLHHAQPQGPSAARNTSMKAATGNYIAFLDADDYWLPDHLESLYAILSTGKGDLAYSDPYVFCETPTGEIKLLPIDTTTITNPGTDLFRRNFIKRRLQRLHAG